MKRAIHFLRTLFWRQRYEMPQRANLCLRLVDSKNGHGKGWTVAIMKEGWRQATGRWRDR